MYTTAIRGWPLRVKRPASAGQGSLFRCGFVALRQPVGVAFLFQCEVGLRALICPSFVVIQAVLFQHGREYGQDEGVIVAVRLHLPQTGVIKVQEK